MKLVVAVVHDADCDPLLRAVTEAGFGATRVASTGGFLRIGNTTVLIGIADDQVGRCLELIRACSRAGRDHRLAEANGRGAGPDPSNAAEGMLGGAVTFVVPVRRFERYGVSG